MQEPFDIYLKCARDILLYLEVL